MIGRSIEYWTSGFTKERYLEIARRKCKWLTTQFFSFGAVDFYADGYQCVGNELETTLLAWRPGIGNNCAVYSTTAEGWEEPGNFKQIELDEMETFICDCKFVILGKVRGEYGIS